MSLGDYTTEAMDPDRQRNPGPEGTWRALAHGCGWCHWLKGRPSVQGARGTAHVRQTAASPTTLVMERCDVPAIPYDWVLTWNAHSDILEW